MKRIIAICLLAGGMLPVAAQRLLSLDSCRALALRNNKQLAVARVKQDVAANLRRSARTKYLPRVTALAGYEYTSRQISLLSDDQKSTLSNLGTNAVAGASSHVTDLLGSLPANLLQALGQAGVTAEGIQQLVASPLTEAAGGLNAVGQGIVDAFHTNTHHLFAGAVVVTQPVYMGGSITAMNRMADISEQMTENSAEAKRQTTLYNIDQAYWTVVSLKHKQKLAQSYLKLVQKLDDDVQAMIREGVATRSEGLSVSVKVNEAEMSLTRVDDGLQLAKMYLAQLCGLPLDGQLTLADEDAENLSEVSLTAQGNAEDAIANRPELKMLQNTVDLSKQATSLLRAGNLPQVALVGGYAVTNPNVYNGFQNKFAGVWNIGVMVRVPVWNWGDVGYKVRAAKGATAIATLELSEAQEKIELQVSQSNHQLTEANKRLALAKASTRRADENLRTANLGFSEGVIQSTTVMEAQTAWLQAQSQMIDAEIDVRLSQVNLQRSLGVLQY
ncbi:MAG: TolC family protein [Prevotella sp.]|nr:TolC family protein [Prevotella sp.]